MLNSAAFRILFSILFGVAWLCIWIFIYKNPYLIPPYVPSPGWIWKKGKFVKMTEDEKLVAYRQLIIGFIIVGLTVAGLMIWRALAR